MASKFVKSNKPAVIFGIIRNHIAERSWKPGDKFSSFEVAKMLGVGRSSVNEAIKLLEGKGFVYILPNVGFGIQPITLAEIDTFIRIRKALMEIANNQLTESDSRAALTALQSNLKLIQATYQVEEYTAAISGIEEYNLALFDLLESAYLTNHLKETIDYYYICLIRIRNHDPGLLGRIITQEQRYLQTLIDATGTGNAASVQAALSSLLATVSSSMANIYLESEDE